ncbi:hypothetical protein SMSP1_01655 [Sedimentisphaera salicampi]|nr:hypothetical protein SMSP1_01655 [Sedimentisphaera salicampi]
MKARRRRDARDGSPLLANKTRRQKILSEFPDNIDSNKFCKALQHDDLHFAQKNCRTQAQSLPRQNCNCNAVLLAQRLASVGYPEKQKNKYLTMPADVDNITTTIE